MPLRFFLAGALALAFPILASGTQNPPQPVPEAEKPAAKPPAGETFRIDSTHSSAHFVVQHNGVGPFYGRFNDVQGSIVWTPEKETPLAVEVTIPVESVDTGSERLDGHLKSPDFFDAENNPNLHFRSTAAKKAGENNFEVAGELTIHGVKKTVTVQVEHTGMREGRRGKRCGFHTSFTIKRSEFGMKYGLDNGVLGDETKIILSVEAVAGGPQAGGGQRGNLKARLLEYDANKDGQVSREEVPDRMAVFFERFDTNGDGVIDAAELDALPERGRGGGRGGREGRRGRGEG